MTIAMILTTAISIGLFGGGLLVVRLADNSRKIYLDRVESQVFLTNDVSANDPTCDGDPCKALRAQIEGRDDVKSVRFLNRDDAYDDAIKKFPQYKDVAGKEAFPASFIVKFDYADILYIAPILLFVGVAMAGVTAYVTLRLYVRR